MTDNIASQDTVELHSFMQERKTLFCYSGPLTEDLLTTISNPVRPGSTQSASIRFNPIWFKTAPASAGGAAAPPDPPATLGG